MNRLKELGVGPVYRVHSSDGVNIDKVEALEDWDGLPESFWDLDDMAKDEVQPAVEPDHPTGCPHCGSGECFHHPNCAMGSPVASPDAERSIFDVKPEAYADLRQVLMLALEQASGGKGAQRHGQGKPFDRQPMLEISRMLNGSPIGCMYQAIKKTQEASRMDTGAAQRELLGAINYLAGAYLLLEESAD